MRKLIWQNSLGDEINLTKSPFGIINWEGFSNAPLNIQSQQVPMQDGSIFLDALIENRDLSVTLSIQDGNDLEKRYELERQLIHILNPKLGEGYLIYTNDFISKRIKCIPQIPLFPNKNSNDPGTQKGELSWTACEPYWEDLEETVVELLNTENHIENTGDVSIGVEIRVLTENGLVSLKSLTQSKTIEIIGRKGDSYLINTNVGKKNVSLAENNILLKGCNVGNTIVFNNTIYMSNTSAIFKINDEAKLERLNTDTKHEIKTFVKKDGYIYFYEQYVGVRRTTDFSVIETVFPISQTYDYYKINVTENGRLVLLNDSPSYKYSDDGVNWYDYNIPINPQDLTSHILSGIIYVESKNKYYGVTNHGIYSSSDMQTWNYEYGWGESYVTKLCYLYYDETKQKFIFSVDNVIYTTTDFGNITTLYTSSSLSIRLSNAGNVYLFSEGNTLKYTTDLNNILIVENFTLSGEVFNSSLENLVYYIMLTNGNIYKSYDFKQWGEYVNTNTVLVQSALNVKQTNEGYYCGYTTVTYIKGEQRGHYLVIITPDFSNIIYSNNLYDDYSIDVVRYNNKFYMQMGTSLYESTDGKDFTLISTTSPNGALYATSNKLLVYVYINSTDIEVHSSENGVNWTLETTLYNTRIISEIINNQNKYYTNIYSPSQDKRSIAESDDGIHFTKIFDITHNVAQINTYKNGIICTGDGIDYLTSNNSYITMVTNEEKRTIEFENIKFSGIAYCEGIIYLSINNNDDTSDVGIYKGGNITRLKERQLNFSELYQSDCKIYAMGYDNILQLNGETLTNSINRLTLDSDLTFGLKVGDNILLKNFLGSCQILYRQKYIGV